MGSHFEFDPIAVSLRMAAMVQKLATTLYRPFVSIEPFEHLMCLTAVMAMADTVVVPVERSSAADTMVAAVN